jgi:NO-binding membrane sensor protein with MHYT domain
MDARHRPVTDFLLVLGGLWIWAAHFMTMYFLQTAFCASRFQENQAYLSVSQAILTLAALLSVVAFAFWQRSRADLSSFMRSTSVGVAALGALGTIWSIVPMVALQSCGTPTG